MANYDILGNIAIIKFPKDTNKKEKLLFSSHLLKNNKSLKTILEKKGKFSGRLRTQKTGYIIGEKTKESLYKENNCTFRLNVETCYFSPRLSNDRKEIADMIKKGEEVLVMFGGIAPYAIVIGKNSKANNAISIELSRQCNKYAQENVKRNKLEEKVKIIQGDVRKVLPKLKQKFDRIVMARPNLKDPFLDIAFKSIKKNGTIHYHGFYNEDNLEELKDLINEEAKKAKKKIKITKIKKAGDIAPYKYRYRVDFDVLN